MEDFVALVRDSARAHLLERAIAGRGAFRRFKDTLLDYPELRRAWFAFHDARSERRAIEWLVEHELVDAGRRRARRSPQRADPGVAELPGLLDAEGVAHRVATDLRRIYGDRLRTVLLTGLWAHGDAHPESELELLVVLDDIPDRWGEKARMEQGDVAPLDPARHGRDRRPRSPTGSSWRARAAARAGARARGAVV